MNWLKLQLKVGMFFEEINLMKNSHLLYLTLVILTFIGVFVQIISKARSARFFLFYFSWQFGIVVYFCF